jgi:hypothetical protein
MTIEIRAFHVYSLVPPVEIKLKKTSDNNYFFDQLLLYLNPMVHTFLGQSRAYLSLRKLTQVYMLWSLLSIRSFQLFLFIF